MRNLLFVLFALATVAGTWGELRILARSAARHICSWGGRTYCSTGDYIDLPRKMLEAHLREDSRVYLVCDGLDSIARSRQIALSWAACPRPVRFGRDTEIGDATLVFSDAYRRNPQFEVGEDGEPVFRLVGEGGGMRLWVRKGTEIAPPRSAFSVSPVRETVGVGAVGLLVLAFGWFAVRGGGGSAGWGAWLCAAVVLLVAGGLALTHTFVAPTGLGVWGGKAKLLYLCGGLTGGFFTDPARATLQPAYPPGLPLLTLLAYAVSGGCGEWLTQLIVVSAASALCALLCSRTESWEARLWVLAALLTPLSLRMASLYYAEPFVALLVLAGWMRIRGGRGVLSGWFLIGAAGLFKNEGIVLCLACWAALRLADGRRAAPLRGLPAALVLPCAWQVGCRLAGGTLYDFAAPWQPDFARLWTAAVFAFRVAFLRPWDCAFAWPLAALLLAFAPFRRLFAAERADLRGLRTAAVAAFAASAAFVCVLSLSRAPDFGWHLSTALPRLLWAPSLLLLAEAVGVSGRRGPSSVCDKASLRWHPSPPPPLPSRPPSVDMGLVKGVGRQKLLKPSGPDVNRKHMRFLR